MDSSLSLFHTHAAGTHVHFARLKVFFCFFVFLGFYTLVVTHGSSRHFWDQREHRVFSTLTSQMCQNHRFSWTRLL